MTTKREKDLSKECIEVIAIGSTGRGTNEPEDGDFDFMVRIDKKIIKNLEELKKRINETLFAISRPNKEDTNGRGDFRYKGVSIAGLDKKVDIDLTFTRRTDEIEYSTEECIKDRLETIKRNSLEDYKYVIANILLAKKVLKIEGVYKAKTAVEPEKGELDTRGGIGAVGIENWVLQNGGSFEKAAKDFLKVAGLIDEEGNLDEKAMPIEFEKFIKLYSIWNFGENYMELDNRTFTHENYVSNMSSEGYNKMVKALKDYIRAIEIEKNVQGQDAGTSTYRESVEKLLKKGNVLGEER